MKYIKIHNHFYGQMIININDITVVRGCEDAHKGLSVVHTSKEGWYAWESVEEIERLINGYIPVVGKQS